MKLEELLDDMRRNMIGKPKSSVETYYRENYDRIYYDGDYEAALYLIENFNLPTHLQVTMINHYLLDSDVAAEDGHVSRVNDATLAQKMSECIGRLDRFNYICESATYIVKFSDQTKKFHIDGKILTTLDLHFNQVFNHWLINSNNIYLFIKSVVHNCFRFVVVEYDKISTLAHSISVLATGEYRTCIIYWLIASSNIRTDLLLNKILSLMTYQDVSDFQRNQTYVDTFIEFCSNRGNQKYIVKFIKKLLMLGADTHIRNSSGVELIQCCRSMRLRNLMLMFA